LPAIAREELPCTRRELPTPIKARLVLHRALQELLARAAARLVPLQAPEAQLQPAAGRMSRVAM
jgi:hypothetical protein